MRTRITLSMYCWVSQHSDKLAACCRQECLSCFVSACHVTFRALKEAGRPDGAQFANWQTWPNTLQACHHKHCAPGEECSMDP